MSIPNISLSDRTVSIFFILNIVIFCVLICWLILDIGYFDYRTSKLDNQNILTNTFTISQLNINDDDIIIFDTSQTIKTNISHQSNGNSLDIKFINNGD